MEGLSERAYAAHSGLSRGAVQKARKTGRLVLFADGSINAPASDSQVVECRRAEQVSVAEEVAALPEGALFMGWLADCAVLRKQLRACRRHIRDLRRSKEPVACHN